jgi:hypothetical protein
MVGGANEHVSGLPHQVFSHRFRRDPPSKDSASGLSSIPNSPVLSAGDPTPGPFGFTPRKQSLRPCPHIPKFRTSQKSPVCGRRQCTGESIRSDRFRVRWQVRARASGAHMAHVLEIKAPMQAGGPRSNLHGFVRKCRIETRSIPLFRCLRPLWAETDRSAAKVRGGVTAPCSESHAPIPLTCVCLRKRCPLPHGERTEWRYCFLPRSV